MERRKTRKRIVSLVMLSLILTSALGTAFFTSSASGSTENNTFSGGLNTQPNMDQTTTEYSSLSQPNVLGNDWRRIFERPESGQVNSSTSTPLEQRSYNWSANEWSKYADFNGNKTRIIVGISGDRPDVLLELQEIVSGHGGTIVNTVSIGGVVRAAIVELVAIEVPSFVVDVRLLGLATYIEPNMKVQAQFTPNDPLWTSQWGPQKIEADKAWDTTLGNSSVLVAIVDTGIYYTHPDLATNYVALGYDWVNNDANPMDDAGHGTHVAGTVAAITNNSVGVAGLAQVRIMAEKVLDQYGGGYYDWVANGIIHAADQGAKIISMSLGGYGDSELVHEAVQYAYKRGALIVAAAGNDDTSTKLFPAGYDEVVAVSATDQNDQRAWFSNWGDWIELSAPGVDILSTTPSGYESWSGTSMATPHVSGLAALIWSQDPEASRDRVRLWLRFTADDLGLAGFDVDYGYGRINARRAVQESPPLHELLVYDWERPPYVEPGATGVFNATVLNFGQSDEANVEVRLLANDTIVDSTSIDSGKGGSTKVSLKWSPTVESLYNVTIYLVPVSGESNLENNVLQKYIYVGAPMKAVVLNSAGNIEGHIIANWQALNDDWRQFGNKMIYIDYQSLNKKDITYADIAATKADVLIISCAYDPYAGWEFTDAEIEAITEYVHEGHGLIATAGTLYAGVPNNNKLAPLFGMTETETWTETGTDLLHLVNAAHPVFSNVPNPLVFPAVGTAVSSDRRWDSDELIGGKYLALGHFAESAIVTFRGLVYISPWLEVIPPYYQHHLQLLYNAIAWSRYQKPQHELVASLEAPAFLRPGESALLNATFSNLGLNNETSVKITLSIDGVTVNSTIVSELGVGASHTINYQWTPHVEKSFNVTAYTPPLPNEESPDNNIANQSVLVMFLRRVAVLGDYESQLTNLLLAHGMAAEQRDWDIIKDVALYDTIVINHPYAPGRDIFLSLLSEADKNGVGLVFTSSWPGSDASYGISLLQRYLNDPQGQGDNYGSGSVYYKVTQEHPIFADKKIGDKIYIITRGSGDHAWFWGYSSQTIGNIGADYTGDRGAGIAYKITENGSKHLLLGGLAPQYYANTAHWSEEAKAIFVKGTWWAARRLDHDLAVNLQAPDYEAPGEAILLEATVVNRGLNNETNVELLLSLNGETVNSTLIPFLSIGESYSIHYIWTPAVEGTYNITAYAPPLEKETVTPNNKMTKFTKILQPLFHPIEGQYVNYTIYYIDQSTGQKTVGGTWNFTYRRYLSSSQIEITVFLKDVNNFVQSGWMVVNIFTRMVEKDSGINWAGMWYPGWIETNVGVGSVINLLWGNATIIDSRVLLVNGLPVDCWQIELGSYGIPYSFLYDTASGLWISMDVGAAPSLMHLMLKETNIPFGFKYDHDLAVSLDVPRRLKPGTSTFLNATVYNTGLSNETQVTFQLQINDDIVASKVIPKLSSGGYYILNYPWTPATAALFNVSAYAHPVPGEGYLDNNIKFEIVNTRPAKVALISEYSELSVTTGILDTMSLRYDTYNNNGANKYTANLTLLLNYRLVVLYKGYAPITVEEHEALNSYLSSRGNLIVTGLDSLLIDSNLANVVRSMTTGDDMGEPDLYVSASHPITNGPYGNFPLGYHITGLYSDCDSALADFSRSAISIAKLSDGFDKIIATKGIPGKAVFWNGRGDNDWTMNSESRAMFKNTIYWMLLQHDVAIVNVTTSANSAMTGDTVGVTVVAENQGNTTETFTVTAYATPMNSTKIYLDPPNNVFQPDTVNVGYRFNVTARVHDVKDLYAYQVFLQSDDTMLNITRAWVPGWDPTWVFAGKAALSPEPYFYDLDEDGYFDAVKFCSNLLGAESTFNGDGLFGIIEFEITAVPQPNATLSCDLRIENGDTYMLDSNLVEMPCTKLNGYYSLTSGVVPPSPQVYEIGTKTVTDLAPGTKTTLTFNWDTTDVDPKYYLISAKATIVPDEYDTADNVYNDGAIRIIKQPVAAFINLPEYPKPGEPAIFNASLSAPGGGTLTSYSWNFGDGTVTSSPIAIVTHTYASSGFYNVTLTVKDSDGLSDSTWKMIYVFVTDVAIVSVSSTTNQTYVGRTVNVDVIVKNEGEVPENFTVTLYYRMGEGKIVETQEVSNLVPGEYRTLSYSWITADVWPGDYVVTAVASSVLGETDSSDNTLACLKTVKVRIVGDINGDNKVDIRDLATAALAFGSYVGHSKWNSDADFNQDGKIDIRDLVMVARNFGKAV